MKSQEVREEFLSFFERKGHKRVPSSSVVPLDDPTLYFTNAGMNQFKDVFLGIGSRDYTRAVDTQKCMRVSGKHNDLEEVGISPWHHTLFEMLGNWSFGDYFKEEAIVWGWELITERYGLEKERLWATVFGGDESLEADEEAERLWEQCTDLLPGRVIRLPAKENFWEMGETGPCGVCSEIHYFVGDDLSLQNQDMLINDTGDMVEIWNLVFIQYNREKEGILTPLPSQHVDTGLGFERICSVLQGVRSNYESDVFTPLISEISALSDKEYTDAFRTPIQVIADHVRALSATIADGALPSNEGRGYVLRRILRRASRYARQLDQHEPFVYRLVEAVSENLGSIFPEIKEKKSHIELVVRAEEEGFGKTLDRGLEIFERFSENGIITGHEAFQLYDTYGFPRDLTELLARERDVELVETDGFNKALESQRKRARAATKDHFNSSQNVGKAIEGVHSVFVGYDHLEVEAQIVFSNEIEKDQIEIFVERTPFYAESGGQVADKGYIEGLDFSLQIVDVRKARGGIAHVGRLIAGEITAVNGPVTLLVDKEARQASCCNHTATHLLHEALRKVLGDHVGQMGSLVSSERLRFDFSHFASIDQNALNSIAEIVNEQIRSDLDISVYEEDIETARSKGAKALFGEKYGDRVRVVQIGEYSTELCGGTHVESTGQIGFFDLIGESGVAAGIRRAEALTGKGAEISLLQERDLLRRAADKASVRIEDLPEKIEVLLQRLRELERTGHEMQRKVAAAEAEDLSVGAEKVKDIVVVSRRVHVDSVSTLRAMADSLREKMVTGVGVLAAEIDGKGALIAVVTEDLVKQRGINAGKIVRSVAKLTGGSGGGKPHLAQAGAPEVGAIDSALSKVASIVKKEL